ncbi:MAG TPA: NAD(P)-dependent oxidoreductase [Candidatus Deferrimicrobium sp.]|nr:NAD(P)-dependent oxidoreductase [Candidatus Deferrimicrobium sp.]
MARPLNVLVTGGAGYIGSAVVARLLWRGHSVRVIDNLSFGGGPLLGVLSHEAFEFHRGDVRRREDCQRALEGVDAVIHLAAIVGDKACRENERLAIAVNKEASEAFCQLAIKAGVARFVFASTCSNYGKSAGNGDFVDETSPLHPLSLYARLKVDFEEYLLGLKLPRFVPTCLRFATAYGISARPRFDLTLNEFCRELALGRRLEVYGGHLWRPYCHVADLAAGCVLVLEADPAVVACQAFNVGGTSENYQKKTLVELILEQLPQAREHVYYSAGVDDPRDYRVSCEKIKTTLGFRPGRKVPDGIKQVIFGITSGLVASPDDPAYRNA